MSVPLHEVKEALAKGFYSENILRIVLLLAEARVKGHVPNPAAFYILETILREVHRRWFEQQPSKVETSEGLEKHLVPGIEGVLRAVDGEPAELLARLNEVVDGFFRSVDSIPLDI